MQLLHRRIFAMLFQRERKRYLLFKGELSVKYLEHAVDIHSHMIPGVDDGAQTVAEGLELARLDREEGMDVIFATPHYGIENGYAPGKELILRQFDNLREGLCREREASLGAQGACSGISAPSVFLGTEWYCSEEIVDRIRKREAFPMGDSEWYMVEFLEWGSMTEPAEVMISRLSRMREAGIRTILAHPERYTAIQEDWDLTKRICEMGVLLQVNAYDLCLNKNTATRELAQWMAKEQLISFLGSDMHGTRIRENGKPARRPQMKEGVRWLYEHTEEAYADAVVRGNAEKYLGVPGLCGE